MKPSDWLVSVQGHYPSADCFPNDIPLSQDDARRFASLWLTEGIPYAFLEFPASFVAAREVLASNLGIPFRDISVTGSGRIGYSLHPEKFGRAFDAKQSDLDLFLVSQTWFATLAEQAERFVDDYEGGIVQPRRAAEERYWPSNVEAIKKSIPQGYLDPKKVPTLDRYPAVQKIINEGYVFRQNIHEWTDTASVRSCSIRIYKSWSSAIKQIAFNIRSALKYRVPQGSPTLTPE